MRDYTKIDAWRLADDLTVAVYECTRAFPREEVYSLTNQIRRASYSVPANIAEGSSRESQRDYLHFLSIARGSLSETPVFPASVATSRLSRRDGCRQAHRTESRGVRLFARADQGRREERRETLQGCRRRHESLGSLRF